MRETGVERFDTHRALDRTSSSGKVRPMPNLCPEAWSKPRTVSCTYNICSRRLLKLVGYLARVRPDTSTLLCRPPSCLAAELLEVRGRDFTPLSSPVNTEDIHRVWKGWHGKKLLRGTAQATAALIIARAVGPSLVAVGKQKESPSFLAAG